MPNGGLQHRGERISVIDPIKLIERTERAKIDSSQLSEDERFSSLKYCGRRIENPLKSLKAYH
jgi:hypothetical protein